ncbi:hypothetical protein NF27_EY01010 [Candidatus Jidaibacter acanthamoeba]|uniref:Uncharacterized protein n=1 Tax=Candidatus Jidaibacter acanthamoebae TaxID=86105 RepID=A0A0C1QYC9_9RICK|nr:hypothetical protein [Candidatus Jidaibacter acanthamoeba]KIE05005.1 hypothetical protein NF27_EY01010 [Candidatus Jidaibacter acanthamoeba]
MRYNIDKELLTIDIFNDQPISETNPEIKKYIRVWRSVIFQAIVDATNCSKKKKNKILKIKALQWLNGNSQDFIEICSYAELDPDYVRNKVMPWIRNHRRNTLPYHEKRAIDLKIH